MTAPDYEAFVERLVITAEVFGEPLSPLKAGAYFQALSDLDLKAVTTALARCERNCRFFPKPVEVREAIYHDPESDRQRERLKGYLTYSLDYSTVDEVNAIYLRIFPPKSAQPALTASEPSALGSGKAPAS
ncbi:MAG TPA: hypothetical protein VNN21_01280 [Dehalococcoidia bacterium]|nr:hypothetical protein [Dehalococcoidia bacterium]